MLARWIQKLNAAQYDLSRTLKNLTSALKKYYEISNVARITEGTETDVQRTYQSSYVPYLIGNQQSPVSPTFPSSSFID